MRLGTLGLATVLAASLYQNSDAVVYRKGIEPPVVAAKQGPRLFKSTSYTAGARGAIAGWTTLWDRDTDVPLRMWGTQVVHGAVADAAIAEAAARQFLAAHLATLAPGAGLDDFVLVSNQLGGSGDVRSVGFQQYKNGLKVLGGTIGFAFKGDRLSMVSSTALPNVAVSVPTSRLAPAAIQRAAVTWLGQAGHTVAVADPNNLLPTQRVIVPIVRPRVGPRPSIQYRVAEQLAVSAMAPSAGRKATEGRWNVWIDANDASPILRQSTVYYATATVNYNVPTRAPGGTRSNAPAANAQLAIDGAPVTAGVNGSVTWAGNAAGSAVLRATGRFASVSNEAGAAFSQTVSLTPGSVFNLDRSAVEFDDAQLTSYIHADLAKRFAKTNLNPTLPWLDQVIPVTVNINDSCNAFSSGDDINFFRKSQQCENTGRISDVVYHEFGHSLHANSIIDGVGGFDGSLSEGISDVLAMAITGDPGMGRGFALGNNAPLRSLDHAESSLCHAQGTVMKFPDDATGEPHNDGEIIGGAMWDVRQALEAKYGAQQGLQKFLPIMYAMFQRASDLQTTFPEALLANDDDGDVSNGTPDQCEITAAFTRHGLADQSLTLGLSNPVRDNLTVSITATAGAVVCPGAPTVESATLEWKPRAGGAGGTVDLAKTGDTYTGDIPGQPEGTVVQYRVRVALSDGTTTDFPKNPADPFYEAYIGDVTPLYCTDFESGVADWTKTPDWENGPPQGLSSDPPVAFAGTSVFGQDLTNDGAYASRNQSVAESPAIDLAGNKVVHLQYQRWLGVEDGFYDHARILANNIAVFSNFASPSDPQSAGVNHVDREWRFHDVDLSAVAAQSADGKIKLTFSTESDEGLEFGGWNLDDLCVVAVSGIAATCGNSAVDDGETCDDGNRIDGDGCSANCQLEDDGGGCCSTGSGAEGPIVLSVLTLGVVVIRRRRRR